MSEQPPNLPDSELPEEDQDRVEVIDHHGDSIGSETENRLESRDLESSWLDPRRILELKEQFNKKLEEQEVIRRRLNRGLDNENGDGQKEITTVEDSPSKHLKDLLRTSVIENAAKKQKDRVEWLAGGGRTGESRRPEFEAYNTEALEVPTEDIKAQMAKMMDWPDERLEQMIEDTNEFKLGQNVTLTVRGKREGGWRVVNPNKPHGVKTLVGVEKKKVRGTDKRYISLESLREQQNQADKTDVERTLEAIKPYLHQKVKVRIGDEVVEGRDVAVSLKHENRGKVYVDFDYPELNSEGNNIEWVTRKTEVNLQEFLETQKEKITAQEQAEKPPELQEGTIPEAETEVKDNTKDDELEVEKEEADTQEFEVGVLEQGEETAEEEIVSEGLDNEELEEQDVGITEEELQNPQKRLARLMAAGDKLLISFGEKIINTSNKTAKGVKKGVLWPIVVGGDWWWAKNRPDTEAEKIRFRRHLRTGLVLGTIAAANYFWHEPYGFR